MGIAAGLALIAAFAAGLWQFRSRDGRNHPLADAPGGASTIALTLLFVLFAGIGLCLRSLLS